MAKTKDEGIKVTDERRRWRRRARGSERGRKEGVMEFFVA